MGHSRNESGDRTTKVWLISGCSSGLGQSLAENVLAWGDKAIVTCRGDASKRLGSLVKRGASAMSLDVTGSQENITRTVDRALMIHGRIDVLVNNAGYVQQGVCEETSVEEEQGQFDTNFFGAVKLTRACLPSMRSRRHGLILNISSHLGRFSRPGVGLYCASKFALEGWSEALSQEVSALGIGVCLLEPGDFRTQVLSSGTVRVAGEGSNIEDYLSLRQSLHDYNESLDQKQRGDPNAAAQVMLKLVHGFPAKALPIRLALGSDSYANIRQLHIDALALVDEWKETSLSTDYKDV